jgi:tetratricopeptide (TPR) repeat protein
MPAADTGDPKKEIRVDAAASRKLRRKRLWFHRFLAVLLAPVLAFGILEVSLRLFGYGYSTSFFVDGASVEGRPVWIDNPNFGHWIYPNKYEGGPKPTPFVLSMEKPEKTFRIFVLGESAAMGFPDVSLSFSRILEVMLRASFPDTRFEVVNCSMVAINSHGVLQIARQCARFKPDLFIVHLGNNEVVGPYGPAGLLGPFSPDISLIRTNLSLRMTRTGQLIDDVVHRISDRGRSRQEWAGMSMVMPGNNQLRADDPRLAQTYANYQTNLRDIIRAGRDAGADVVLCTVPVNLRDCAPFGSLHTPGLSAEQLAAWDGLFKEAVHLQSEQKLAEALRSYREAESIDDEFAELHFRSAQCFLGLGANRSAQSAFARARDLDSLRFRTDSSINGVIREMATANQADGVRLADADKAFAEASTAGSPGADLFLEHVHMTFKGNYLLALQVYKAITNPRIPALGQPGGKFPEGLSEQEAGEQLAHTDWADLKHETSMYERLIKVPPFTFQFDHAAVCRRWEQRLGEIRNRLQAGKDKEIASFDKAVKSSNDDWMIRKQYGEMLFERGKYDEAGFQLRKVVAQIRHCWDAQCILAGLETMANRLQAAEQRLRNVVLFNPEMEVAFLGLSDVLDREGDHDGALAILQDQLKDHPDDPSIIKAMGVVLFHSGKAAEARERLNRAIELSPNDPEPHVHLGLIAMQEKKAGLAISEFKSALKLKPDWSQAIKLLHDAEKEQTQKAY